MADTLTGRIESALTRVINPRLGLDVMATEQVRDIATTTDGKVRLTLLMAAQDSAELVREVRQAVEGVPGVTEVRVQPEDAETHEVKRPAAQRSGGGRTLPVMNATPQQAPPPRPAPTPVQYPHLGRIIAVSSGKGGVGKSTVAVNLAAALASRGATVGLMDADIYGPNVPRMMGVGGAPHVIHEKIIPNSAHGVKVMSLGFIIERDQPAIWRGPIIMKVLTQFLRDVAWGELDYLVIDLPPGTGDAQLSLVQATQVHGVIIVTTPQQVATGDALRGARMFQRVGVPVLGIVENMSWLECPHCGKPSPIFGSGGGAQLAEELSLPLLGQIPLYPPAMASAEAGMPIVLAEPESSAGRALRGLATVVAELSEAPATK